MRPPTVYKCLPFGTERDSRKGERGGRESKWSKKTMGDNFFPPNAGLRNENTICI